jgi:hypothetical protein
VLDAIDPGVDSPEATRRWGELLHPVQDFYSRSAWVDPVPVGLGFGTTHRARLLDDGLGNWRIIRPYQPLSRTTGRTVTSSRCKETLGAGSA